MLITNLNTKFQIYEHKSCNFDKNVETVKIEKKEKVDRLQVPASGKIYEEV